MPNADEVEMDGSQRASTGHGWWRRGRTIIGAGGLAASFGLASALAIAANTPARPGAAVVDGALVADEANGDDWPSYGRTYSENHYSPLDEVNRSNIGRLKLAWSTELDVMQRADAQPLEAGGVVYVASGLSIVQAFDAVTGQRLWRFDPEVAAVAGDKMRPQWGIRGLSLWKGKVIVATPDGRLIALDGKSGEKIWSTQTLPGDDESAITGAPRVGGGIVFIGFGGAERRAIRGAVQAFDAETGKFLWRFHTVPGDPALGFENKAMEMAAKTWSGEWWKHGGGGTVWNAMTYDPELNRLYIGTGNGGPWDYRIRNPKGGDALFLASIVALDARTGSYVWHYQQNPNEAWDYNSTMDIAMATLPIDGKPTKVLMQAPKNGFYYVIDRETGKLISAEKFGRADWASGYDLTTGRPIETANARYEKPAVMWPGTFGVHNWQPMAYSPKSRLTFIPTIHMADAYSSDPKAVKEWKAEPNAWNSGITWAPGTSLRVPTEEFGSSLQAWNPVTQQRAWQVQNPGIINGGVLATGGDLVFQGHLDGTINAFDAASGTKLWSSNAGVSVLGAPISYRANGRQYVSVMAGPPSGSAAAVLTQQSKFGWRYRDHPRRLLTFVLDGAATLPETPPPGAEQPLVSTALKPDAKYAAAGETSFNKNCMTCHGVGAIASGAAPDLRASPMVLEADTFAQVVRGGALLPAGMPAFPEIGDRELLELRHYVRREAASTTASGRNVSAM